MTMQVTHSPKPKIFGKGYAKHIAHNYVLMKTFFWLGWKMLVSMIIPAAFYESAHWEVIDLYHKMRGFRHGTNNDHRCSECGYEKLSVDSAHLRQAELKDIEQHCQHIEEFDRAMGSIRTPEEYQFAKLSVEDLEIIEQRIEEIRSGKVEAIDWRDLDKHVPETQYPDRMGGVLHSKE